MSKADVEAVFGPQWVQDERRNLNLRARAAEQIVLALRHALRCVYDGSLPDVHDGAAWRPIEDEWHQDRVGR